MEKAITNSKKKNSSKKIDAKTGKEVEVLYQRLGGKWFAFSVVDDDVYFGEVPSDLLEADAKTSEKKSSRMNRAA